MGDCGPCVAPAGTLNTPAKIFTYVHDRIDWESHSGLAGNPILDMDLEGSRVWIYRVYGPGVDEAGVLMPGYIPRDVENAWDNSV